MLGSLMQKYVSIKGGLRSLEGPRFALCLGLVTWVALSHWGCAAEPAREFLEQLQARGYHDVALAYLERLEQRPLADEAFQQALAYHQGETLIQAALLQRTAAGKASDLDRAQSYFERFVQARPNHPLALAATGRMADILVERARLLLNQAEAATVDARRRSELQEEARQLFALATETFQANQAELRKRLEAMPNKLSREKDAELIAQRDQMRADYVQAQFVAAMLIYEEGLSYDVEDPRRRQKLVAAEAGFGKVAEKYRQRMAGLSAVLFQGRCRQRLGEPRKALEYYEDLLLTLPDNDPVLRSLKTKTLRNAMECWMEPDINQLEAARQRGEQWIENQKPTERADDDWLGMKLLLARVYHRLLQQNPSGQESGMLSREARRLAIEVAKYRSDSQQPAQELLAELGQAVTAPAAEIDVKSFGEAIAASREALSRRQVAAQTVELLAHRLAAAGPNDGGELAMRLEEAKQQVAATEVQALELLRRAQELITDETPEDQVNQVRFYLCTLYYYQSDFYRAAVMADFLASRYPGSDEGRRAAAVSLASLVRLYGNGTTPGATGLRHRITRTAERIAAQWKGQPEADDALATLVTVAIQDGKAGAAEGYLDQMSTNSPRRAAAEIALGQTLWNSAQQELASAGDPDAVESKQRQAIDWMTKGLKGYATTEPSPTTVAAMILVAEHNLRQGQPLQALELLEKPESGPKFLADRDDALLADPVLKLRVHQLALLCYVAALPEAGPDRDYLTKALETLDVIQKAAARGGGQDLSGTYVALAQDLQTQIRQATAQQRGRLVTAFQQFLDRAAESSGELSVLNWVADAYQNLGQSLEQDAAADSLFAKSVATYQKILERCDQGTFTVTNQERLLIETRLAMAFRAQGNYEDAVRAFAELLQRENTQLYIQVEAAKTFQLWGDNGNQEAYLRAILGDVVDPKTNRNVIWGFGRIAKLVAGKPQFDTLFHEARFDLAFCRYHYALAQSGAAQTETLQQAEQDIVMTAKLYPDLGGADQQQKYDRLLREIQSKLGKPVRGLP